MSGGPAVPPGQHPPFAVVTDDDHRAWIIITAALGLSFILVTFLVRFIIRKTINHGWGWDDSMAAVGTAIAIIQSTLVLVACAHGLGKSIELVPERMRDCVQQLYYASNIFFLLASDAGRLSTLLFLRRLMAPGTLVYRCCNALLGVLAICTFAFVLATALTCDLSHPWLLVHQQCSNWWLTWQIQAAFSIAFEVAIFVAPIWLLWDLKRSTELKLEVIGCFAPRVFIIIFIAFRLATFHPSGLTTDPTLREAVYICWTQAEMDLSIMAATIPTARRFILNFISYYNVPLHSKTSRGEYSDSYPISSLVPSDRGRARTTCEYSGQPPADFARKQGNADDEFEGYAQRIRINTLTTVEFERSSQHSEQDRKGS